MEFHSVSEAISELRKGRAIVVVDDKDRENEGDVVFAASKSTPAKINFLAKHARGLICVALSPERVESLKLLPMAHQNGSRFDTAFTVSVEALGVTTGISASDRSLTAKALSDLSLGPEAFVSPGHSFPVKARSGGVLVRAGHTEATVDLMNLAGLGCAGVMCEIMKENGSMARLPDCMRFAKTHGLKIISVENLIQFRRMREKLVRPLGAFPMPTPHGEFRVQTFEDLIHGRKHFALVKGEISSSRVIPVRVHSECLFGDTFGSQLCDCGELLQRGMETIQQQGGIFLYMRQINPEEDFGGKIAHGIVNTQPGKRHLDPQHHASAMDARTYGIGAQILFDLGVRRLNLMTNHPRKIQGLEGYGLKIVRQTPFPGSTQKVRKTITKEGKR